VTEPSEPDAGSSVDVPPGTVVTAPPPDEAAGVSEGEPPVIVVTPEGSLGEDPGAPLVVVAGARSPGVEMAVPSEVADGDAGDEDPGDEDPGAPAASGVAVAGPPVMTVTEPSDWLQASVPPSGAAASSS